MRGHVGGEDVFGDQLAGPRLQRGVLEVEDVGLGTLVQQP